MKHDKIFFWQGSHSYHRLTYHIVFAPKYRKRVLQGGIKKRIRDLLYECCKVNQWFIHELEIMPDHIHFLIQLPATIPVCKAVMFIKGGSARILRKEFPELEEFLWGDSFWQDGYFAETIGRMDERVIREYIRKQNDARAPSTSHGL